MGIHRAAGLLGVALLLAACGNKASGPGLATKTFEIAGYEITVNVSDGDNVNSFDQHVVVGSVLGDSYNGIKTIIAVLPCERLGDPSAKEPCPADAAKTWAEENLQTALSARSHGKPMFEVVEPATKYAEHAYGFVYKNITTDPGAMQVEVYHSSPAWPNVIRCAPDADPEQAKHWKRLKKACLELEASRGE